MNRMISPIKQSLAIFSRALLVLAIVIAYSCWSLTTNAQASAGALDPSFGAGGKVILDLGINAANSAVAVQSDGKIVAAGVIGSFNPISGVFTSDFLLTRYNTNGSLDLAFGVGGKVTTEFFSLADRAAAIALQPDGKIVAAGDVSLPIVKQRRCGHQLRPRPLQG